MLRANGQGGSSATVLAAHFAKRNTKFGGGGRVQAGKNPPPSFFPARAFRFCSPQLRGNHSEFSLKNVRTSFKKHRSTERSESKSSSSFCLCGPPAGGTGYFLIERLNFGTTSANIKIIIIFMNQEEINVLAQTIWDYHHMNHQLKKADCIFVLGSHDTRVAEYAADLFLQGLAPYIIFSGGLGSLTVDIFKKPEAEIFADIALAKGIPKDKMIIENKSTNTGENVQFTREILKQRGLDFNSFILVQKPYMERRAYATFKKIWPEKEFIVTSPPINFVDYPNNEISKERVINIMVGDLQRIKVYSERGFQIFQEIPDNVWEAYKKLIKYGFTAHLIND